MSRFLVKVTKPVTAHQFVEAAVVVGTREEAQREAERLKEKHPPYYDVIVWRD